MKLHFKKFIDVSNLYDNSEIEFKTEATTLPEIVEEFRLFLLAIGFSENQVKEYIKGIYDE